MLDDVSKSISKAGIRWMRLGYWGALFAFVTVWCLARLAHEPLWLDETYSLAMAEHGWLDIVRLTTTDVHPPLYYLVLRLVTGLFGTSPFVLRLPSTIAVLGLLLLGAFPIRRIWGERTALMYSALVATSPGILCFAQEARMYTLAAFFVTGAVVYGILSMVEQRRGNLVCFGLFTWASAMTHYFGLVAAGMNCLALMAMSGIEYRSRLKPITLTSLGVGVLYAPWLIPFTEQVAAVARGFWIPPMTAKLFTFALVAPFAYKFEDIPYPWQAIVAFSVVVLVVGITFAVRAWRGPFIERQGRVHVIAVYLLTFGFGLVFSKLVQPVLMPRYLMVNAGLLLLATAASANRLPHFRDAVLVIGCLIALNFPASMRIQKETFNGPFVELAEVVRRSGETSPVLLHNDCQTLYPSLFAVRTGRHILVTPRSGFDVSGSGVYQTARLSTSTDLGAILATTNRVWVVDMNPTGFHIEPGKILTHSGWKQVGPELSLSLSMSWVKVRLLRFEFSRN